MPINFDALRQAQLDQVEADFLAERSKGPTVGDYGRALGVGAADIPTSIGEGLSLLGLESVGGTVRGFGEDAQESLVEGMTLGGRRAATAPILESDTPIATTALKALQTLPGVAAMAIPGALAVRGLGAVGKAAGITKLAPQVLETGATLPSKLATALGFGSSEGVYSGLSNAAQTRSEIMNQDIETLGQNPLYQKHLAGVDPSLAEGDRQQLAREAASREAEWDVTMKTTLTTGLISTLAGGGVFAAVARPTGSIGREAARGAAVEAVTEAPQSALEQVHQNVALSRPTTEGASTAAIEGGILGGLLGGGIGGINAAFTVPGTTQADIDANVPPAEAPTVVPPAAPPAAPKVFTDMSPEETASAARTTLAEAALRSADAQAQAQAVRQFGDLFDRAGGGIPFTTPTAVPLTTTPGAAPAATPITTPIGVDRYAFAGIDKLVPKAPVLETVDFKPAVQPELTTSAGAQPPATPPRADQIGIGRFAFQGLEGIETPEAATARIAKLQAQGAPRSADPKLPRSFRDKTVTEFETELETSTLSSKTVAKAEQYLNTVLIPQARAQADELTRLQTVVNPAPEVVAPPAAPQTSSPAYVAAPHAEQYQALKQEFVQGGIDAQVAETSLQANYSQQDGFDVDEVRTDITDAKLGQATFETRIDQIAAKSKRGRPTKEQQAERAAATAPQGVISDPDPDVQENARAIVADQTKLAQLRQMATEPDAHPLTLRLKKAVDELIGAASQPTAVVSRPRALGPDYFTDDEELNTWQELRSQFIAAGVEPDAAEAILARNYDDIDGFDREVLIAELQVAEKDQDISQGVRAAADELTADELAAAAFSGTAPATRSIYDSRGTIPPAVLRIDLSVLDEITYNELDEHIRDTIYSIAETGRTEEHLNETPLWLEERGDGSMLDAMFGPVKSEYGDRPRLKLGDKVLVEMDFLDRARELGYQFNHPDGRSTAALAATPAAPTTAPNHLAAIRAAVFARGAESVDTVYRPGLEAFIKGPEIKTWLSFPSLRVYVRKARRRIEGEGPMVDTFDLANIEVDESARGSGIFTKFLDVLEHVTEEAGLPILVEEIQNPKLPAFFENRGYTMIEGASPNAFKPVALNLHHLSLSPRAMAHKLAAVQTIVDRALKQWKRSPFGGVEVHETIASLPQGLQNEVYSQGAQRDARGIYDTETGTVHIIASNLATPEETEFVLFHETLGHFGLRGFLKGDFAATMRELYKQNPNLRRAANALMKEFNYNQETATEEALADMAGRNVEIKGVATLLAKIQKALRAVGLDSVANWLEKRTNAEVMHVLAQAKLFVTEGKGAPHIYTPATSKLLYSYAGSNKATLANQGALAAAEQFDELGIPMAQIRATTGWFKGMDEKWKFEISDQGARLSADTDNARTVGQLLDHPTLFANYPYYLPNISIRWMNWPASRKAGWSSDHHTIQLNAHLSEPETLSSLLHELQHAIQFTEGFARGGGATTPEVLEAAQALGIANDPDALLEVYQHLAGEIEARDVQARALMTDEERALNAPYTSEALTHAPIVRFGGAAAAAAAMTTSRFSRTGQDAAADLSGQIGEFYNFSAPFQRAFRKLASFGSKSSAARTIRLGLSRSIASPYHLATAKKADGTLRSPGFANLFQNVLRQKQQFSDYIASTLLEPIEKTWVQGQGLGKPPAQFEAAARALFAHNDSGVTTAEFFNDPKYAAGLDPKARELYDQVRETMKRGLMAEFTAKAIRMQEVLKDHKVYAETIKELYARTQQRIDSGFIPDRRHGTYAVGAYHKGQLQTDSEGRKYFAGQPMQWYTFESIGEAQAGAKELRTLFQGQTDVVLDIDAIGKGQPLTVERAANDQFSKSAYWDFLQQAQAAGISLDDEAKGRLAKLMISSESVLQNKIQRRKGVPGYSKDLMRTLGEFITSAKFSVAQTHMSARITSAMNKRFFLSEAELAELNTLRERFKDFAAESESRVYEALTQEPDLTKRFAELVAYNRMKFLEVSGGQFWAQDGADKGYYRDRANELINFLESPKASWADSARSLAALHFLGGSVASAVVNLSSLPMFSAPYLHQYVGAKAYPLLTKHFKNFSTHSVLRDLPRLAAALDPQQRGSGQAAQDWKALEPLGEDLLIAVQRASEEGIISDSQIHELFGFARGGLLAHSSAVRKGISAWMAPFRLTEQANRFATFMAAFEAGQKGITDGQGGTKKLTGADLYTFARDAVDQTQAIYGPINRQPWARNPVGHALFTFRAFPLMMSELWLRLPSPQRTLVLGSLVLAAGVNGIPFADDLRDIIDTIAQRVFGEPLNTRRLMTNMVAQASESALGVDLSRLIMNGSLDAMTGASISGRIGFGNLIPGTRAFAAGEDFFGRTMKDVLGPVGVEAENFAKAFQGDLRALLPSAARNFGKAVEAARYGKLTDPKGQTLIDDVTAAETFMQGLGFTSGRLSQAYETQRGLFQEQAYVDEVKQGFLNEIRTAVAHNDTEALTDVREEITAWNETHTQWPIAMKPSQLRSTLKLAGLPLTERTLKLLPRAWRAAQ